MAVAAKEAAVSEAPISKPRPIVRLGLYLISHSFIVSVVCYIAGVIALLLLPVLAKNTYISENALMPGSANSMLSSQDVLDANRLVTDIAGLKLEPSAEAGIEGSRLLAQYMSDLGAEVNHHKFYSPSNKFHPLHFFSSPDSRTFQENFNGSSYALSTIGIIRAPSGDGKEAIVLVTPYNSENIDMSDAVSLGVAYAVFSLFSRVTWLAKDIIWLAADSKYGEYAPVSAWLNDYHSPVFGSLGKLGENQLTEGKSPDFFRRAGTMAAALVIKVSDGKEEVDDTLSIYAEASNGQMPNLDLINIVNYLAVHKQGLRVKVKKCSSLIDASWIKIVGEIVEFLGNVAKSLNHQWKFGIPVADYIEGTATLASSLYYQALGVPTGPHGAFRDYQVDAITLEISPKFPLTNKARRTDFLMRNGRLVEGVVRCVNNLLEKFHQSFFLYLLTSPSKFVSVGVYMIGFALLVAPLPVVAASLYAAKSGPSSASEFGITSESWRWLPAAKQVFVVHFWGVIVSLLPYLIYQIPDFTPTSNVTSCFLLSIFTFLILYLIVGSPSSHVFKSQPDWAMLKAVTISSTFISLCLMSVINFATAQIGALLLVPICLLAHPLKHDVQGVRMKALNRAVCNIILVSIAFPPMTCFVIKGVFEGLDGINVVELWNWVESLWAWNSATYLYLGMGYLPCWALCSLILFHPC